MARQLRLLLPPRGGDERVQAVLQFQTTKHRRRQGRPRGPQAKFGDKKLVVVTGTSSGLGRKTARALVRTGKYHVVGAVRDVDKMAVVAEIEDFDTDRFTAMECELNSFESVRDFCKNLDEWRCNKPIDRLICNAGVYQPSLPYAKWSADGHEQTMQINYLSTS